MIERIEAWLEKRRIERAKADLQRIVDRNRADRTRSLEFRSRSAAARKGWGTYEA